MGVFEGCQIVLDLTTAVRFKVKTQLRKDVTSNGGVVSFIVTKKSTHVVCNDAEKADVSYKCRQAGKYGLPVVSVDWISRCVETGTLLDTDQYLLVGKTKSDSLKEGKISATRFQKKEKKKSVKPYINVSKFKAWSPDDKNCPKFSNNYELAKYAVFINEKSSKKQQTFAVLEVHVDGDFNSGNSVYDYKYRVTSHAGDVRKVEKGQLGSFEYRFCSTVDEVLAVYSFLYKQEEEHGMTLKHDVFSQHIGSEKFRMIAGELGIEGGVMKPEVSDLVELIWYEALGELNQLLTVPVTDIKMEQIEKAEAILKQTKSAMDSDDKAKILKLMIEFYSTLKHVDNDIVVEPSKVKAWISRKSDLCQLMKDMISVSEATNWSMKSSTQSKYKALRCVVDCLPKSSSEYDRVSQHLMSSLTEKSSMAIQSIYAVNRPVENVNFTRDVSNIQELFHASKVNNIVGILSRGLLMPKVVVDDLGGTRSDPGMLGSGIYFASSASTSIQYSTPSKTKGSRFMLICEVALGNTKDMYEKDLTLTTPPEGYNSVHGVKSTNAMKSAFKDDEFVIYNTCQQRIKYIVEFTTDSDVIKHVDLSMAVDVDDEMTSDDMDTLSLSDVQGIVDPMSKVKAGLVSKDDTPVNLKSVHIRAKLMDLASEVVVLQEYENNSKEPLEAKYVFPLSDLAAVCGFEAFINGKHIVGEVKEKETAHREYKKAVSEGHGAYLMDQDEETPDVFTVSVGNLPPGASVLIKITYVAELQAEGDMISFRLPGSVAPWKKDSLKEQTQMETDTVEVKQGDTSVQISVDMPFDIRAIECPTHKIKTKRTLTKATVEMLPDQTIEEGFQLYIGLAEIHVPRMWVERKPGDSEQQACMLTFYPEFEAFENDDVSVALMLDLSNSMKGDNLVSAKKILLLTLQELPPSWNFNIIVFGTAWRELFPCCVTNNTPNRKLAAKFIMNVTASMGNTEVIRPMHSLYLLKPESFTQNVFIISDGHLNNADTMMTSARENSQHTRIFTLGIGSTADRHLLRNLARGAAGTFEFFDSKAKSKWEGKVKSLIHKAAQPGLTSVRVHWEQHGADVGAPVQAPSQITALFNGSRSVIYGYVPNCTMATLTACIGRDEVSTMVSTSDLSITEGNILHRLTARTLISDWEDGVLSPDRTDHEILKMNNKQYIIELSKEYSIVTQFTSFVAIEKRDKDEEKHALDTPAMSELIERENVDQLQYMGYEDLDKPTSPQPEADDGGLENLVAMCADLHSLVQEQDTMLDCVNLKNLPPARMYIASKRPPTSTMSIDAIMDESEDEELEELYGDTGFDASFKLDGCIDVDEDEKMGFGLFDEPPDMSKLIQKEEEQSATTFYRTRQRLNQSVTADDYEDADIYRTEDLVHLEEKSSYLKSLDIPLTMSRSTLMSRNISDSSDSSDDDDFDDTSDSGEMEEDAPVEITMEEEGSKEKQRGKVVEKPKPQMGGGGAPGFGSSQLDQSLDAEPYVTLPPPSQPKSKFKLFGTPLPPRLGACPPSFGAPPPPAVCPPSFGAPPPPAVCPPSFGAPQPPTGTIPPPPPPPQPSGSAIPSLGLPPRLRQSSGRTIPPPPPPSRAPLPPGGTPLQILEAPKPQIAYAAMGSKATFDKSVPKPQMKMFSMKSSPLPLPAHGVPSPIPAGRSLSRPPPLPEKCAPESPTPASVFGATKATRGRAAPKPSKARLQMGMYESALEGASAQRESLEGANAQSARKTVGFFSRPPVSRREEAPQPPPLSPEQAEFSQPPQLSNLSSSPHTVYRNVTKSVRSESPIQDMLPAEPVYGSSLRFESMASDRSMASGKRVTLKKKKASKVDFEQSKISHELLADSAEDVQMFSLPNETLESKKMVQPTSIAMCYASQTLRAGIKTANSASIKPRQIQSMPFFQQDSGCVSFGPARSEPERKKGIKIPVVNQVSMTPDETTSVSAYSEDTFHMTGLSVYGIGVNVPLILKTSEIMLEMKDLKTIGETQKEDGSWVMDRKLQDLLGIDFELCKTVLEKAGLKSLGAACYETIIKVVSTLIVMMCIIKSSTPGAFPTNLRLHTSIEAVLMKFSDAVENLEINIPDRHGIKLCVERGMVLYISIDDKYPLVCSQLELGQEWIEFVGKILGIHSSAVTPAADQRNELNKQNGQEIMV